MNTQALRSADFCPFKGLDPYTEDYRDYFFGRERDQKTIISNLHATPLTVLYGASGVGKSSVLMAGVVPQLRQMPRRAIVIFRSWQGDNFVEVLKREVLSAVRKSADGDAKVDLAQPFEKFLIGCNEALGGPIFFIFDQFEEYFLYHAPSRAEDSFDALLARAVNRKDIDAKFLLAMREEELSKLDRFRGRIPNLLGNTLRLKHLDRESAERAIREPLIEYNRQVGDAERMGIEDELVAALIDKATPDKDAFDHVTECDPKTVGENSDAHVETPVLQMLLTRLWNEERKVGSHTLRLNIFEEELRGAESIMGTYLKEIMDRLTQPELEIAAGVFRFLVTPSRTKVAQDPSVLASWADLDEQQVLALLTRLSSQEDMRLLRKVRVLGQAARYEIFHDVLARAILEWRAEYVRAKDQAEGERRAAREAARNEKEAAQQLQLQQAQALAEAERKQAVEQRRRAEAERLRAEEQERRAEAERQRAEEQQRRVEAERHRAEAQQHRANEQARASKRSRRLARALALMVLVAVGFAMTARMRRGQAQANERRAQINELEAIAARQKAEEESDRADARTLELEAEREELDKARSAAVVAQQRAVAEGALAKRQTALARERALELGRAMQQSVEDLKKLKTQYLLSEQVAEQQRKLTEITIPVAQKEDLQIAVDKYNQALQRARKSGDQTAEADILISIGSVYARSGQHLKAQEPFEKALAIREMVLGPQDLAVATSLNQIAVTYYNQGKYAEAERMYKRAQAIWEKALGPEHPYVAAALSGLAIVYRDQAKYADAERLLNQALAIRQRNLGTDRPETARTINELAILYRSQARYVEAELLFKQALAIRQKALGPEHPDVLNSQAGLARLYYRERKYSEAEPLFNKILESRQKMLGPNHPSVANTVNDLATLYRDQDKYVEAELLYKRALVIREKILDPAHPELATTLNDLADLYYKVGNYAEAEPLYKRALEIREKTLGPIHPDLKNTLQHYAALLRKTNREAEAAAFEARAGDMLAGQKSTNSRRRIQQQ